MELMNRDMQRKILSALADRYPNFADAGELGYDQADPGLVFNLSYLHEHELVAGEFAQSMSTPRVALGGVITARGLDFLQDDGGLSAILNVVTVRLDAQTLRALITRKIEAATDLPEEEKSALMAWLKNARSEALQEATSRLVAAALDHAPNAIQLLRNMLG